MYLIFCCSQSGYVCMVFYKRDHHVIEVQSGKFQFKIFISTILSQIDNNDIYRLLFVKARLPGDSKKHAVRAILTKIEQHTLLQSVSILLYTFYCFSHFPFSSSENCDRVQMFDSDFHQRLPQSDFGFSPKRFLDFLLTNCARYVDLEFSFLTFSQLKYN